jgi:hypothetical protein
LELELETSSPAPRERFELKGGAKRRRVTYGGRESL